MVFMAVAGSKCGMDMDVAGYSLHLGKHEDGLEKIPSRCLPRSINNLNNLQTSVFN
jgi:hypothetical protein